LIVDPVETAEKLAGVAIICAVHVCAVLVVPPGRIETIEKVYVPGVTATLYVAVSVPLGIVCVVNGDPTVVHERLNDAVGVVCCHVSVTTFPNVVAAKEDGGERVTVADVAALVVDW
jgi:hypothetical protein